MSEVFLKGTPLADAFFDGVGLGVSTWGAYASIVADPINLNITDRVEIRDSFVALAANIRSQGQYFATVREIADGNSNTSQLIPNIAIPVSAEVIFDVNVADYTISPMMSIESVNIIDNITFDFDVDLKEFIDKLDLDAVFANLTGY